MIATDRALSRRLLARCRRLAGAMPGIRMKRSPLFKGRVKASWIGTFAFSMFAILLLRWSEQPTETVFQLAGGWTLLLYVNRLTDFEGATYSRSIQFVGYCLPVSDSELHAAQVRQTLGGALRIAFVWLAALTAAAIAAGNSGFADWLVIAPAAAMQALAAMALAAAVFVALPRLPWTGIVGMFWMTLLVVYLFFPHIPETFRPSVETMWAIFEHSPPMLLDRFTRLAREGEAIGWLAMCGVAAAALATLFGCYRISERRFVPARWFDPQPSSAAARPPAVSGGIIRREIRRPPGADYADSGALESWVGRRLPGKSRIALEVIAGDHTPLARVWFRGALVVIATWSLGAMGLPGFAWLVLAVGGASWFPIFGGQWRGIAGVDSGHEKLVLSAFLPLSFHRLAWTAVLLNFLQILLMLPLALAGLAALLDLQTATFVTLKIAVILAIVQPPAVIAKISSGTNDTRVRWWVRPLAMIGVGASLMISLVMIPVIVAAEDLFSIWQWCFAGMLFAFWYGILALYLHVASRNWFDFVTRTP